MAFVKDFEQLKEFRDFLDTRLGVPDEQVATIEWSEIVNLLVRKQSQHRLFIQEDVQQFDILARICREDNYIIALYNRLDEFFPCSLSLPFGLRVHTFNGVMLSMLKISLLGPNCLITSNKLLSDSFVRNFEELKDRFRMTSTESIRTCPNQSAGSAATASSLWPCPPSSPATLLSKLSWATPTPSAATPPP